MKIRDDERSEEPHVTFIRGTTYWRWSLRSRSFMDDKPPPHDVPAELVELVEQNWDLLRTTWDAMYPHNPVWSA